MKTLCLILVLIAPVLSLADQPRYREMFRSENGKYELKKTTEGYFNQRWSLVEKSSGESRFEIRADISSMTALVTNDGRAVAVVDDYSEKDDSKDLDVLFFYRDGVLLSKYQLGDLLIDSQNLEYSVSHFSWTFKEPLLFMDKELRFQTFELIAYRFDMETGKLLSKDRDEILSDDSIFVYGDVKVVGEGLLEIKVCRKVYGDVPRSGKIRFKGDFVRGINPVYAAVVIENGEFVASRPVILNQCNVRDVP